MTELRKPRSPLRVALMTFGIVLVLGLVLGVTMIMLRHDTLGDEEAAGERFGRGLAQLAVVASVIAYFVQWQRTRDRR